MSPSFCKPLDKRLDVFVKRLLRRNVLKDSDVAVIFFLKWALFDGTPVNQHWICQIFDLAWFGSVPAPLQREWAVKLATNASG